MSLLKTDFSDVVFMSLDDDDSGGSFAEGLSDFDIVHFHIDLFHYPAILTWDTPTVTTLHGRLDIPDLQTCYRTFSQVPLVSISQNQRMPMPPVNWIDTVYHGLPDQMLPYDKDGGDYLVFLGRISPVECRKRLVPG